MRTFLNATGRRAQDAALANGRSSRQPRPYAILPDHRRLDLPALGQWRGEHHQHLASAGGSVADGRGRGRYPSFVRQHQFSGLVVGGVGLRRSRLRRLCEGGSFGCEVLRDPSGYSPSKLRPRPGHLCPATTAMGRDRLLGAVMVIPPNETSAEAIPLSRLTTLSWFRTLSRAERLAPRKDGGRCTDN